MSASESAFEKCSSPPVPCVVDIRTTHERSFDTEYIKKKKKSLQLSTSLKKIFEKNGETYLCRQRASGRALTGLNCARQLPTQHSSPTPTHRSDGPAGLRRVSPRQGGENSSLCRVPLLPHSRWAICGLAGSDVAPSVAPTHRQRIQLRSLVFRWR